MGRVECVPKKTMKGYKQRDLIVGAEARVDRGRTTVGWRNRCCTSTHGGRGRGPEKKRKKGVGADRWSRERGGSEEKTLGTGKGKEKGERSAWLSFRTAKYRNCTTVVQWWHLSPGG